jgi:small subunit ribosomal protein S8
MKEKIVAVFVNEGYLNGFQVLEEDGHKKIIAKLKYTEHGSSVIRGLKRISKPGRRLYVNNSNLTLVLGGLGNGVVSTSRGIKTVKQCLVEKIGGEYICQIW